MYNINELIPMLLILMTCIITFIGFNNAVFFQRYQFHIGPIIRDKQYLRLISSGFLHANWSHLFFNMLTLYFFQPIILYTYGVIQFLILYFASLLGGNLFTLWLYRHRPSYMAVGSSGAISGIIFASIALYPDLPISLYFILPMPAWVFGCAYFGYSVYMLLNPRQYDYIGHSTHLGGAVIGIIFVGILSPIALISHALYIGLMSLPLLYLGYQLFFNKR